MYWYICLSMAGSTYKLFCTILMHWFNKTRQNFHTTHWFDNGPKNSPWNTPAEWLLPVTHAWQDTSVPCLKLLTHINPNYVWFFKKGKSMWIQVTQKCVGITLIFLMLSNCKMLHVTGSISHFQILITKKKKKYKWKKWLWKC